MIEYDLPDLLARTNDELDFTGQIERLTQELAELQAQARALVVMQGQAHTVLSSIYDEQLQGIGERMEIVQRAFGRTKRAAKAQDTSGAKAAFHSLPENLLDLWEWDGTSVIQLLHSLMRRRRLVMKDGEIVGTQDAQRKERKRTYFGKHRTSPIDR